MIARIIRSIFKDRRGAAALVIAMMTVPLIVASGAAVDFSRISSARAQMQLSVDSAALAGAGAYQVDQDGTQAYNVANTAFKAATANLNAYTTLTSTVGTLCYPNPVSGTTVTCGTTSGSNGTTSNCPSTTIYCVQVTAHAVLQNSLLAIVIPSDTLNVTSTAQSTGGKTINTGSFAHQSIGYGSDLSAIYAYAVPTDTAGNAQYGNIPAPNSKCTSAFGPIQYVPNTPAGSATTCNYVLIGENSNTSGSGSITLATTQPVGFTFVNFTGGTITSGTEDLDTNTVNASNGVNTTNPAATAFTNEIYVTPKGGSVTYYANGYTTPATTGSNAKPGVALYGNCPAHNLYGSINAYPNASNDMVPYQDSINTYASAQEMLGYPPTHGTNHALLPFLGPVNTISADTTYTVQAVCPQWQTTNTKISATAMFTPSTLSSAYTPATSTAGYPSETVAVYSTYYPDVTSFASGSGTYPPEIGACTPATSTANGVTPIPASDDAGVTPASDDPWWGFSPANNTKGDPGGASENPGGGAVTNCTKTILNSGNNGITSTKNYIQTSTYNDCAFIIQPLGTNTISALPDYYQYMVNPGALASQTSNPSYIVPAYPVPDSGVTLPYATTSAYGSTTFWGMTPIYDGTGNTHAAGYTPGSDSFVATGISQDPYLVSEPPIKGSDHNPPEDTSHQCYNPQANGFASTDLPGADQPNNDNNTTIDPVSNPEFGAVFCTGATPSFELLWNDMGSYAAPAQYNDDLGYANAISEFTCPSTSNPGTTGPATLVY